MPTVADRSAFWPVPIARAVPAITVGLVITFSANHSPQLGMIAFGVFAVLSGAVLLWGARRLADRVLRGIFTAQGVVAIITGALALIFSTSGLGLLLFLLTAFAAGTGFLELYAGLRARGRHPGSRDWLIIGGFTAIAALIFLLIPLDSVETVGLLGAYGILIGLFLVIAGLSLKWANPSAVDPNAVDQSAVEQSAVNPSALEQNAAEKDTAEQNGVVPETSESKA